MLIGVFVQPLVGLQAADSLEADVDQLVADYGVTDQTPGVAILVRTPDRVVFPKGYGLADIKSREPITPRTMFELASVGKSFTATAILILQTAGKLSVEDDVRKHVPELPEYRKGRAIRVRDLLQHVSGLPEYMSFEDVPARNKDYWANEDYAGEFARQSQGLSAELSTGAAVRVHQLQLHAAGSDHRAGVQEVVRFVPQRRRIRARGHATNICVRESAGGPAATGRLQPRLGYNWRPKRQEWVDAWACPLRGARRC